MSNSIVTEDKLKDFYEDIKPFLGCPAYLTSEGTSDYYSTDEKVIGRWIDGKPLYQKTINFGALPNTSEKKVSSGLSNVYITFIDGFCKRNGGVFPLAQSSPTSAQWCVALSYDYTDNTIAIATGADRTEFTDCYITLKYTKTTDSASTTVQEDPNEYSTDEKIIGKWIDGKPLYQKTIITSLPTITTDVTPAQKDVDLSYLNMDYAMISGGYVLDYTKNAASPINCSWGIPGTANSLKYYVRVGVYPMGTSANQLFLQCNRSSLSEATIYITIQYTKTTD